MLHELAHNVHGPHDGKFHALWDQLRDEHEALAMKGYTGEGFLSQGQRLGGSRRLPMDEARRLARAAAEQRGRQDGPQPGGTYGGGRRLGGSSARPTRDIRSTIAEAAARRNNRIFSGCANDKQSADEIRAIADTATKNGFRTQAEEDAANEAAIAQALWELVQEDEKKRLGNAYIPPEAYLPQVNDGDVSSDPERATDSGPPSSVSRAGTSTAPTQKLPPSVKKWSCTVCTLENPGTYLCCDACGTVRPVAASHSGTENERPSGHVRREAGNHNNIHAKRKRAETRIDLTGSTPLSRIRRSDSANTAESSGSMSRSAQASSTAPQPKPPTATWTCSFCGRVRERQWWSCDMCGNIKDSSA